jgi:hypothetical protein
MTCPRCNGSGVFTAKRVKAVCELCAGSGQYKPKGKRDDRWGYCIVRFYHDDRPMKVIVTKLTLKQAQEYCRNPATQTPAYFDGYAKGGETLQEVAE